MTRGLRGRLVLTHVFVAALVLAVAAVFLTVTADRRFDAYLNDVRARQNAAVVEALRDTYQTGVGWDARGIYALSRAARVGDMNLAVYSPDGELLFTVQGIEGTAAVPGDGAANGQGGDASLGAASPASPLTTRSFDIRRYPVRAGGARVATVEVYAWRDARGAAEDAYDGTLDRDLVIAAGLAAIVALLASVVVARRLTGPLEELAEAAGDVVAGNLEVRIAPRGDDEVARLAVALDTMADALARNEQWRRDLTADLSDELLAPLASVQTRLEALEEGRVPVTPENLRVAGDEVERLGRLLGALRTLNEVESEDLDVELASLDLHDVVAEALSGAEAEAARRRVTLSGDLDAVTVRGDRGRLAQVMASLLDNALKFTPAGGTIVVGLHAEQRSAVLSVADTGPGIDPVDLPFVFDRFYRSPSARGTQGVGLGLAIVKGLVEAHGGTVDAGGDAGGGAVFTVRLPLAG